MPLDVTKSDELDLELFSAVYKTYSTNFFRSSLFFLLGNIRHIKGNSVS